MLAPRWIGFLGSFGALVSIHLVSERLAGVWQPPRINEASEVFAYYLGVGWAIVLAALVVGIVGFPLAIMADRLFQSRRRSRIVPYLFFASVAIVLTGALLMLRDGQWRLLDLSAVVIYFFAASCLVWKISYESPRQKTA